MLPSGHRRTGQSEIVVSGFATTWIEILRFVLLYLLAFEAFSLLRRTASLGATPAWLSRQEVVYIIPESGVLLASQIFPLLTRHSTVAKVYGGDKFTCERPALTVWCLPIAPDLTFRYLIGTDCEYIQWMCDNAEQ